MLTIFSTPKPFKGHSDIIQRNAIKSWTLLHPDVEVILFGDEEGAAAVCKEFGIYHEPEVRRADNGTKYLGYFFDRAQELARHKVLCYVNCDIILMSDFRKAVETVMTSHYQPSLMIGRRWDADITEPLNFSTSQWEARLRKVAKRANAQRSSTHLDYFVFSERLYYKKIPPFVIGRIGWDPWLVWHARSANAVIVDASSSVMAVHQNHDYSYHPQGEWGVGTDSHARENLRLLGGWRHRASVHTAQLKLTPGGLRKKYMPWADPTRLLLVVCYRQLWFRFLDITRPIRHPLGLRYKPRRVG
jgi:hypothetical protein